jgi:hypothetical protein
MRKYVASVGMAVALATLLLVAGSNVYAGQKPTPSPVTYVTVSSAPDPTVLRTAVQCPLDHPHATGGGVQTISGHVIDASYPVNSAGLPATTGQSATGWYGSSPSASSVVYAICAT